MALATSTYLLMRYPETLKQLTTEIRESFDSEADITISSTMNLPYLIAVINETLRIHHPTPINLPRIVPPEGQMSMATGSLEVSVHPFPRIDFLTISVEDD